MSSVAPAHAHDQRIHFQSDHGAFGEAAGIGTVVGDLVLEAVRVGDLDGTTAATTGPPDSAAPADPARLT